MQVLWSVPEIVNVVSGTNWSMVVPMQGSISGQNEYSIQFMQYKSAGTLNVIRLAYYMWLKVPICWTCFQLANWFEGGQMLRNRMLASLIVRLQQHGSQAPTTIAARFQQIRSGSNKMTIRLQQWQSDSKNIQKSSFNNTCQVPP